MLKIKKITILLLIILLASNCGNGENLGTNGNNQQEKSQQEEPIISQEQILENKAKQVLQPFAKQQGPTQSFFQEMATDLDGKIKDIRASKDGLEEVKKIVEHNKKIKTELEALNQKYETEADTFSIKDLDPTIQPMFNAILEITEIKEARKKVRQGAQKVERNTQLVPIIQRMFKLKTQPTPIPIDPNNLSPDQQQWFKHINEKYQDQDGLPSDNVDEFVSCAIHEEIQNLLQVTNANLALFENLQKELKNKKAP
jgi:hypothetical protein